MQRWQYFFFHFLFQGDNIKRGWKKNMSGKKHGRGENVNLAGSLVNYQTWRTAFSGFAVGVRGFVFLLLLQFQYSCVVFDYQVYSQKPWFECEQLMTAIISTSNQMEFILTAPSDWDIWATKMPNCFIFLDVISSLKQKQKALEL